MSTSPVYDALTVYERVDDPGIDAPAIARRNTLRTILTGGAGNKAKTLVFLTYAQQQTALMLPTPMEHINTASVRDRMCLLHEGVACGCLVSPTAAWYPRLNTLQSTLPEDSEMQFSIDYPQMTIRFRGRVYDVTIDQFSENTINGTHYTSYTVQWPTELNISAALMLEDGVSDCTLNIPGRFVDIPAIAQNLKTSMVVMDLLDTVNLREAFLLADSPVEMVSIAVLALYNSLHGR